MLAKNITMIGIFCYLFVMPFVYATWLWNPDTGWINTKYDPQETAQVLYRQAIQLQSQKEYHAAAEIFQSILTVYPNTPEAHKSVYEGAQCHYLAENYYSAYLLYEEYLRRNPRSENTGDILVREYEIGTILIRGKGKPQTVLGFDVQSSGSQGAEILQKLVATAPYATFADSAQLTIANYYFKEEEYSVAYENYQKLAKDYPKSEWAGFAQYQTAICYHAQFRGLKYDPKLLNQSQQQLDDYFKKFGKDSYSEQAKKQYQDNLEMLATKEWNTAQYYLDHDDIPATRIYLLCLIQKYPETQVAKRADELLKELEKK